MKLHLLAIGVHPDDVELGCSGTLINEVKLGKKVGILDLTQGELGSRGNIETRAKEAAYAASLLGVEFRENLKMRDGFFEDNEENRMKLIQVIRKYQPDVVICNIQHDRHPDHGRAGKMIAESCFLAGLMKIDTVDEMGTNQQRWRPSYVLHYLQDWYHEPQLLIDITSAFDQRMKAIGAYGSQFYSTATNNSGDPQTYISTPDFLESIIARARMLGKRIGVKYAEGFTTDKSIGIRSLDSLVQIET